MIQIFVQRHLAIIDSDKCNFKMKNLYKKIFNWKFAVRNNKKYFYTAKCECKTNTKAQRDQLN